MKSKKTKKQAFSFFLRPVTMKIKNSHKNFNIYT